MIFAGLLIYLVLLYLRPADWMKPILNWPLEFAVLSFIGCALLLQASNSPQPIRIPQKIWVFGWLLAIVLSNLSHGNLSGTLENAIPVGKKIIILFLFLYLTNSVVRLKWISLSLVLLSALLGLQGIYQVQNGGIGFAGQTLGWDDRIRWVGLWDGPNVLSLAMVLSIPFVFAFAFDRWGGLLKFFALTCGGLILAGIYLAGSRGGLLALCATMLFLCRKWFRTGGLLIGGLLVLLVLVFGPSRLRDMDYEGSSDRASSARGRISMWAEGLEMLKYNPVFGIGKGEFRSYTGSLIAHNIYIEIMGETGLFGFFFAVGLIYFSFRCLTLVLQNKDHSPPLLSLARGIQASLFAYMAASLFITTEFELIYILVAMAAATWVIAQREAESSPYLPVTVFDMRNIACIAIGVILFMYATTSILSIGT